MAQGGFTLWVRDLRRGVALRVATPEDSALRVLLHPVWAPDDARLAFVTTGSPGQPGQIRLVRADGAERAVALPAPPGGGTPLDWSPDGTTLLVSGSASPAAAQQSLWLVDVHTRVVRLWLAVGGSISAARFSPDGRWVAYQSDETGEPEVYLRPFPGPGAPVRVSVTRRGWPTWRGDGRELFYLTPTGDLLAVAVSPSRPGRAPDVGAPRVLLRAITHEPYPRVALTGVNPYDVSPDGQRFVLNTEGRTAPPLTLLAPWPLTVPRPAP